MLWIWTSLKYCHLVELNDTKENRLRCKTLPMLDSPAKQRYVMK